MKSVSSRRRQQRKQQTPGDVESDESESDPDQLISSRTESSNQLDAGKLKHSTKTNFDLKFIKTFSAYRSSNKMSFQFAQSRTLSITARRAHLRTFLPCRNRSHCHGGGDQGNDQVIQSISQLIIF